jgi:hypothetical protein
MHPEICHPTPSSMCVALAQAIVQGGHGLEAINPKRLPVLYPKMDVVEGDCGLFCNCLISPEIELAHTCEGSLKVQGCVQSPNVILGGHKG